MERMLKWVLNNVKSWFYKNIKGLFLYIAVVFVIRIMEVCYNIKNVNYLMITLLFISGWILYKLCAWVLKRLSNIVILFGSFLVILSALFNVKSDNPYYIYSLFLKNYHNIDRALRQSKGTLFTDYLPFLLIAIPAFTVINLYFLKKNKVSSIIAFMLIFMLRLWYTGYGYDINKYFLVCIFLCTAFYGVNTYAASKDSFKEEGYNISILEDGMVTWVIIISLIIASMGYYMLKSIGSSNYIQTFNKLKMKSGLFQNIIKNSRYTLAASGYGENGGKLGGPIILDDSVAFRVQSDNIYYLRGNVRDFYDGFQWKKGNDDYKDIKKQPVRRYSRELSRYLMMPGVTQYSGQRFNRNIRYGLDEKILAIYPETLVTSTIFAPNNTHTAAVYGGIPGADDTRSFTTLNQFKIDTPYSVYYSWSRLGIEKFLNFYDSGLQIRYSTGQEISDREKEYYENNIRIPYGKYLQLPDNISPEIYILVQSIIKDCNSTTEKVYKIYDYLYHNYTYSTEVTTVPEGHEFLDYFLFTEEKGYCTYFATATTIFLRIAGIPARYVEGFTMGDVKDEGGLYVVTNSMAHAWTEVLLLPEEDLWTTLDSTPPGAVVTGNMAYEALPIYSEEMAIEQIEYLETEDVVSSIETQENFDHIIQWSVISIVFISLLSGIILYMIIRFVMFFRLKWTVLHSKSIIPVYYYTKKRLKTVGSDSSIYNDDMKWLETIDDRELKGHMKSMIDGAYREFFGRREVEGFNKDKLYDSIESHIRKRQNYLIYYLKKFFI